MVHVLPNEAKKSMIMRKCTMCSVNKPRKKSVSCVQLVVEQFAKLHVAANITPRKTAKQAHKNSVSFQSEILTLPLKNHYKLIGKKINTASIFNSISLNGLPGYLWHLKAWLPGKGLMFQMCYTWKRLTEAQTDVMYNVQYQKPAKVNEAIKV